MSAKDLNNQVLNKISDEKEVNLLSLPKINKVVVSVGLGPNKENKDLIASIEKELSLLSGQKPRKTKAKKSIAGFKIREGQHIGYAVTLRGKRLWQFIAKVTSIVLPRVRDFDGISESSIDKNGNLNFSFREQTVFPEIKPDETKCVWGMVVTLALDKRADRESAKDYYKGLGFVFK
jgi:large subunit ribosomal protein L5